MPKLARADPMNTGVCGFGAWYTVRGVAIMSVILVPTTWARGVCTVGTWTPAKAALMGDIPTGVCAFGVECALLGKYMPCRGLSFGTTKVTLFSFISNPFFIRTAARATFAMFPNDLTTFAPWNDCTGEVTGD
eukprot:gnl/MRDRNA2_/MRDRNA2_132109_c0_seq1.p2 gnl/MRDRNA2_/MRDRNA2_132109_c0~~gnl/MRDRNA2_/MRDRNA2_132109_c0_seq1.p2  ORF type:complete len:133 (+),score=12.74 gnl/MRDRNA2_/MRDRNA2_132109_c0_seq1:1-399(+)